MPENKVRILSSAWSDLDRISDFHITMVGPVSAEKITDKILNSISSLEKFPLMGMLHSDPVLAKNGYRRIIAGKYVIIYKIIGKEAVIYRIVNGTTDYTKEFSE